MEAEVSSCHHKKCERYSFVHTFLKSVNAQAFKKFKMPAAKRKTTAGVTKTKRMRMYKSVPKVLGGEHRIKIAYYGGLVNLTGTPPPLAQFWKNIRPRLQDIPGGQLTTFTAAFDMYKINAFTVKFLPRSTQNDLGSSTVNPVAICTVNKDPYNILAATGTYGITSFDNFMERCTGGAKHYLANRVLEFTQSRPMTFEQDTGEMKRFPWTTINNVATFAFGMDFYFHAVNFANFAPTSEFDTIIELDVTFKGRR